MTLTIAFLLCAALIQAAAPQAGPWKSLFDGKSMNAWRIFKTDTAPKILCDATEQYRCVVYPLVLLIHITPSLRGGVGLEDAPRIHALAVEERFPRASLRCGRLE